MQREIRFRGKTIKGEWIYGLLAHDERGWFISNRAGRPFAYAVRPETIGQYTGLKDKNGVDIYEGDIIEKTQYNKNLWRNDKKSMQVRYAVKWDEQKHDDNDHNNKILAADPSAFSQEPGFIARKLDYESTKNFGYHNWSAFANCEVIGTIHDTPNPSGGSDE